MLSSSNRYGYVSLICNGFHYFMPVSVGYYVTPDFRPIKISQDLAIGFAYSQIFSQKTIMN